MVCNDTIASIIEELKANADDTASWNALHDACQDAGLPVYSVDSVDGMVDTIRQALCHLHPNGAVNQCELHGHYAEPGYSAPECGIIATGNWNEQDGDTSSETLLAILEGLGIECEWSDEWTTCHQCQGLIRTQPDCHSWQPSYEYHDGGIVCHACMEANRPEQTAFEQLDTFTQGYVECALFASTDDDGEPLDRNYSPEDLHPSTYVQAAQECDAFRTYCAEQGIDLPDNSRSGTDFFLSRNGHGAGYFDGFYVQADALQRAARAFGESNWYIGGDGMIHVS